MTYNYQREKPVTIADYSIIHMQVKQTTMSNSL